MTCVFPLHKISFGRESIIWAEVLWRQAYSGRRPLASGGFLKRGGRLCGSGGGNGGGGCVCGEVVVVGEMAYRLQVFEGSEVDDGSLSSGRARGWFQWLE